MSLHLPRARAGARRRGFTLIEVMAAILLTSIVIAVASTLYLSLSQSSLRAETRIREALAAATALDRIGRDLEGAFLLVKPEDRDPLSHPWLFVAESLSGAGEGSDHVKLTSRRQRAPGGDSHVSDLAQVAYVVVADERGGWDLMRWSSPGPPTSYDPSFPAPDDPRSQLLAEGLASFSLRFLDTEGEWLTQWDSSQLLQSSQLPQAVEISLTFRPEDEEEPARAGHEEEAPPFVRIVVLPLPPLDLDAMIAESLGKEAEEETASPGEGEPDADSAGAPQGSIADCVARNRALCEERLGTARCDELGAETGPAQGIARDIMELLGCL